MTFIGRLGGEEESTVVAIARNIQAMLRSAPGHGGAHPIFGLADHAVYEHARPYILTVAREILVKIGRFEPRLAQPSIRYDGLDGSLWARYIVSGVVEGSAADFEIRLHVIFRDAQVRPLGEG